MTDAEWLRERPEIVEKFADEVEKFLGQLGTGALSTELLAAILPLLRAAIRAEVVRERAGERSGKSGELVVGLMVEAFPYHVFPHGVIEIINAALAAAHAQGRAAGREEAAKMADAKAQELYRIGFCNVEASLADNIATAIRSLP